MKKRTERSMNWALVTVLGFNVIGAVWWIAFRPGHNDLFESGTLVLETVPTPGTTLPHAHAISVGSSLQISGRIRRTNHTAAEEHGTVTITAQTPDRKVLSEVATNYVLSQSLPHGGGGFSTMLPSIASQGSTIRILWTAVPSDVDAPPIYGRSTPLTLRPQG